jgi:hypothetical protein
MIEPLLAIWKTYPYLWGTLILLGITFLGSRFLPKEQRSLIWLSGLANTPAFIFVVFLQEAYWAPDRLGHYILGIEDALVSFVVGAMAWLLAAWPHRHRLGRNPKPGSPWRRYPWFSLPIAGVYLLLVAARVDPMTSLFITLALAGGVFLSLRPDLRSLSLSGLVLFPLCYYFSVKLVYLIWPDFIHQWNLKNFWGNLIGGVPAGELVWAAIFGACWPLCVSCLFQARLLDAAPLAAGDRPRLCQTDRLGGWLANRETGDDFPGLTRSRRGQD